MRDVLEQLLRAADVPNTERAELLWAEYRGDGPGAEEAFATLLAWYGLSIYRRIWGFVRSDAAEDVFQDVLAKLHRQRQSLATFEHALRWLRMVAVRQSVDAHRREARRKAREHRASRPEGETLAGERAELQEMLADALTKLSKELREVVALVFFEGLSRQDAAKVLGINRDTLADRLNVALSRLQRLVPAPAVLATAGAVGVPATLSAEPPVLSAARLSELAKGAWAKASPSGLWLGKVAAVLVGLAGLGGATWVAWPQPDPVVTAAPQPPRAIAAPQPLPTRVESVSDRNLRIFRAEVLPLQKAALKGLVVGGAEIVLRSVQARDTRIQCVYELPFGADRLGVVSHIEFIYDTSTRRTQVYYDMFGDGQAKPLDPERPLILGQNPLTGSKIVIRFASVEDAVAAFVHLPQDEQTESEARAYQLALEQAIAPYLGRWYIHGDASRGFDLGWTQDRQHLHLRFVNHTGSEDADAERSNLWIDPDGRCHGLPYSYGSAILSRDGRQMRFRGTAEWWSREPITTPMK
jgi:RNA polymerase sigma-70 factor (ECF subfamily)